MSKARGFVMYISQNLRFRGQAGVSLVELLVVMLIIATVCAFALMQRGRANEILKRQNVAQQLKSAFERARFDSVKRRADSTPIQANVSINLSSYTIATDLDLNGVLTSSDNRVTDLIGQSIEVRNYNGSTGPEVVYFNQRGETVDAGGSPISPIFNICNSTCNSPNADNSNIVLVTTTGTVNLLPGGSQIPNFSGPTVTSVPPTTSIKDLVQVP